MIYVFSVYKSLCIHVVLFWKCRSIPIHPKKTSDTAGCNLRETLPVTFLEVCLANAVVLLMVQNSGEKTSWGEGSLSHYLQGIYTSQVVIAGFLNHQQYVNRNFSPQIPGWKKNKLPLCFGVFSNPCHILWSQQCFCNDIITFRITTVIILWFCSCISEKWPFRNFTFTKICRETARK